MSLDDVRNCIGQNAVKQFLAVDELLSLRDTVRRILGTDGEEIDDCEVHVKQLLVSFQITINVMMLVCMFNSVVIGLNNSKLVGRELWLHVDELSKSFVLDNLFHDILLIAIFIVLISFNLIITFARIGLLTSQLHQQIKQSALEVTFHNDFVYQVIDELLCFVVLQITLDYF